MGYKAAFRVWRGDAEDGELQDFSVEVNEGEVVLDVIHRLQATQAGDLAVRWNCKAGKCGSCSAEVNGRPRLMCMTRMSIFSEDQTVTVTPLRTFPVIKDLVTDVSFNYVKAREIPSFTPPPDLAPGEYRMQQVDVERSQEFRKCIECFLCQNTCHVIRDHEDNKPAFAGPRFFIRLAELEMHPLDVADRRRAAQEEHGLGLCNITKCCTEVCPEGIKITDNGIIPMKERVVDARYDPVTWLGSRIPRRGASAGDRALDSGDALTAEQAARSRLAGRPHDTRALATLEDALLAQGRFAEAAEITRREVQRVGPGRLGRTARMKALNNHAWALLCAVESGQLDIDSHDTEISTSLEEAQTIASTGTLLAGTHALHALVHGQLGDAETQARDSLAWDRDSKRRSDDLLTLSEALAGLGDTAAASSALAEAHEQWPANPRLAGATANVGEVGVSPAP